MTRKGSITGWKRAVLTALMAYAFVLQTVLVSLGGAAHAADMAGPQGIICHQDGQSLPDHDPAKAHDGLCCTLSGHGAGPAGPLPAAALPQRLPSVSLDGPVRADLSAPSHSSDVLPVGSRAPPRLG